MSGTARRNKARLCTEGVSSGEVAKAGESLACKCVPQQEFGGVKESLKPVQEPFLPSTGEAGAIFGALSQEGTVSREVRSSPKPANLCLLALLSLLALILTSCGYRPVGRGEAPAGTERPTLAIPLFANRSTEVGLESLFANTFIETFSRSPALRLQARPEEADLVLEGKISSVAFSSTAFFNVNRSLVRRVTIQVDLQLTRRSTGKVIWKDQGLVQEDYVVDQTYQEGEALKDMGVRRGAVTLARKMLDKVLLVI